jgi:hypothetical protein
LRSSPRKGVYTPKGFLPHAALLRQAFAHCGRFLAAASRRSRGRVSVPVWLAVLSDQLPIIATVGRHPTVQLIGRRPLLGRRRSVFLAPPGWRRNVCGITRGFPRLSPTPGQVAHVLRTRPPRSTPERVRARLACIRHAASVDPEPGSNSPPMTLARLVSQSPETGHRAAAPVPSGPRKDPHTSEDVWPPPGSCFCV